jgi:hypothetical protein
VAQRASGSPNPAQTPPPRQPATSQPQAGAQQAPPDQAQQQPAPAPTGTAAMAHPNQQLDPAANPQSQNHPANPGAAAAPPPFDAQNSLMTLQERLDGMRGSPEAPGAFIDAITADLEQALTRGNIAGAQDYVNRLRSNRAGFARGLTQK